jgi:HlyD family secretion protein
MMKILERPRTNGHAKVALETLPPKRGKKRLLPAVIAIVVVLCMVGAAFFVLRPQPGLAVVSQPVSQGTLAQSVTATGTVNAQDTVNVGTQVSGTISQLYVDYNSKVKKGQVLAKLDATSLQDALNQAQASLAQSTAQAAAGQDNATGANASAAAAQANAAAAVQAVASAKAQIAKAQSASALAQQTVARDKQLLSQGYIAQSQYDTDESNAVAAQSALQAAQIAVIQAQAQQQAQIATAQANAAQAKGSASTAQASQAAIGIQEAQVAQAQYNLNNSVITSPVDGTVIARDVSVGQTVAAGFQTPTLFSIAKDLTKMEVDLQVGEPDIGNVRAGDPVSFTVLAYPTRTFTGTVSQVRKNATTVQNVVTYTTVVLVDNKDGALLPGMTANATIGTASIKNALIVPVAALQWHPSAEQLKNVVGPTGQPFGQRKASTNGAAQGSNSSNNASKSGSPWGSTGASGSSTVVAGTRGRLFVSDGKQLRLIPVQINMVNGASAAVSPLHGTLAAGAAVVVGGGTTTKSHAATSSSPFNTRGGGTHIPGGGGYHG